MKLCECGCGKEVTVNRDTKKNNRFIRGHSNRSFDIKEKKRMTCLRNFGEEYPMKSKINLEKSKQTCIKKYGVDNIFKSEEIKKMTKITNLEKFGTLHPSQCQKIKDKMKQTNLDRFGVEFPMQSNEIKIKAQESTFQLFGVDNVSKSDIVKEKKKITNLKKYGVENPMQCKEVQLKHKQTTLDRFGVENSFQSKTIQERIQKTNLDKYGCICSLHNKQISKKVKETRIKKYGVDHFSKTEKGKQVCRVNFIRLVENQKLNGEPLTPRIGDDERPFLNELQQYTKYNIIRNDNSFRYAVGRFPDGHIPELKLFIQFDERSHFHDKEMKIYKQDDLDCTLELASMGYVVFRVSKKDWEDHPDKVISDFKEIIECK